MVADFSISHGPTAINRYDRTRRVTIEGDLRGDAALGEAVAAIHALPTAKNLPPGVEIRETGDVEVMSEVFASFAAAMGAGLMMVYGLLVLLFGSFLQPITILISLPLSIGGAIIALLITHKAMSMPVVIGILMLMGIVTKNAIMLVDFAVEEIGRGTPRLEALVEAGRKRARPIVMTTIAMAAGMFPSALGLGDGGGFRSPMAIAVIGGLVDVDAAVAGVRAGGVHGDGRRGPARVAAVQPPDRRAGRGACACSTRRAFAADPAAPRARCPGGRGIGLAARS